MRRILCPVLILVAAGAVASAQPAHTPPPDVLAGLPADLRDAIDAFYAAIENDDVEARVDLLAEDVILLPDHWTALQGKPTVANVFRSGADAVFELRDREVLRAEVSGDLAYTVNSYFFTYHAAGDEPRWHKTKNVHLWRRGDDGAWRLAADIWNSDVPAGAYFDE